MANEENDAIAEPTVDRFGKIPRYSCIERRTG